MCEGNSEVKTMKLNVFAILVISILLIIGVEIYPGPRHVEDSFQCVMCGMCKKNLRSGLWYRNCNNWYHLNYQKVKREQQLEDNWSCCKCNELKINDHGVVINLRKEFDNDNNYFRQGKELKKLK